VIRRRFLSGLENLERHYKMAVNDWIRYDNSGADPVALELGENR
jgi:predicted ABC-type ATPase